MGQRIKVFWPQERAWFRGKVLAFDNKSKHHVKYNDGDEEWLQLADEKWELLQNAGGFYRDHLSVLRRCCISFGGS